VLLLSLVLVLPTAKQLVMVGQDTPLRSALAAPDGLVVVTAAQVVPFHCSTNVVPVALLPTAVQVDVFEHDTATSRSSVVGSGDAVIVQAIPFQCSVNVLRERDVGESVIEDPTAVQSVGFGHDTPLRRLRDNRPVGFGLVTIVQVVPFQCSVNVCSTTFEAEVVVEVPTAMQLAGDGHDTPSSSAVVFVPVGRGVDTIDQVVPFQCSARLVSDVDVEEIPTAAQSVTLAHDTPLNAVSSEPVGFGDATVDQLTPFHRSINTSVVESDTFVEEPTAKQSVAVGHDTPFNESYTPVGLEVATTVQLVPFQCSANAASFDVPTALQSVTLGQDTCRSWLCDVCETSGATDQRVPSQRSTDAEFPTAAQLAGLGHDTPVSPAKLPRSPKISNAPGSAGLATIDQLLPFHCSTSALFAVPIAFVA